MMRRGFLFPILLGMTLLFVPLAQADKQFESPHVHPIELSPDGTKLFAVNTPDHRLTVYDMASGSPVLLTEIQVGMEPSTVRARSNTEVWVVNHISDSISIIDLNTMSVVKTLLVGDEPTDVVFAGSPEKAFVCMSQLDLIRVYDTTNLAAAPVDIPLDACDPFALSLSPAGDKLYVASLDSQNNTTIVPEATVDSTLGLPPPSPPMDTTLAAAPMVGLIVRHDGTNWLDELNRSWDQYITYELYDNDVFEIDVATNAILTTFKNVGTTLMGIATNPVTGRLYTSNLEAFNEIRFEPNLRSHFVESRVTRIDPATSTVVPVHLNSHINYGVPEGTPAERALSLGSPFGITVNSLGTEVFVAAYGNDKVGVLDADGLVTRRINVGSGPTGLTLDEARNQLYVLNRHFGSVSVVDLTDDSSVEVELGFDPTPITTQIGRTLFFNTANSSGHGDAACSSCHIFANGDGLAWDLGDPTGAMIPAPQPQSGDMHPMKGPLVTQPLRDLAGTEPLHWRGDRPDLAAFNETFVALQGRATQLSAGDMLLMEEYLHSVQYAPNPLRELDGSLQNPGSGPNPSNGENLFFTGGLVGGSNCDFCHAMPTGTSGTIFPPLSIVENQPFESPQFRHMYEKVGFTPSAPFSVRGFGFTHEGDEESIFTFTFSPIFTFNNDQEREDIEAFLHRFDTGSHAATGQQLTMDGTNEVALLPRLNTLLGVAVAGDVGVIAKGSYLGLKRGWVYDEVADNWQSDRTWAPTFTTTELLALAGAGTELTFTAVPPGCETRLGVDRDNDTWFDRDELDAGTDPADPGSTPTILNIPEDGFVETTPVLRAAPNPAAASGTQVQFNLPSSERVTLKVYDVQGRQIRNLLAGDLVPAGDVNVSWDLQDDSGRRVSGGIYFVQLQSPTLQISHRLVVTN